MYKLAYVIRFTVESKFVIFHILVRRLIHSVITGGSLKKNSAVLLHKFNRAYIGHSCITGKQV